MPYTKSAPGRRRRLGFAVPPLIWLIVSVVAATGIFTLAVREAYDKYVVAKAEETELSRLKTGYAEVTKERDSLKAKDAQNAKFHDNLKQILQPLDRPQRLTTPQFRILMDRIKTAVEEKDVDAARDR